MRGTAVIGDDQARAQHQRRARNGPAISDSGRRRLLIVRAGGPSGPSTRKTAPRPIEVLSRCRDAPALERAGAAAWNHHHVDRRHRASAARRFPGSSSAPPGGDRKNRCPAAADWPGRCIRRCSGMRMRPGAVAQAIVAESHAQRRTAQQADQPVALAAVMQIDRRIGARAGSARVAEAGHAHEFVHPGQGRVVTPHVIPPRPAAAETATIA